MTDETEKLQLGIVDEETMTLVEGWMGNFEFALHRLLIYRSKHPRRSAYLVRKIKA
jgi:hypothetical protein